MRIYVLLWLSKNFHRRLKMVGDYSKAHYLHVATMEMMVQPEPLMKNNIKSLEFHL